MQKTGVIPSRLQRRSRTGPHLGAALSRTVLTPRPEWTAMREARPHHAIGHNPAEMRRYCDHPMSLPRWMRPLFGATERTLKGHFGLKGDRRDLAESGRAAFGQGPPKADLHRSHPAVACHVRRMLTRDTHPTTVAGWGWVEGGTAIRGARGGSRRNALRARRAYRWYLDMSQSPMAS